MLSASYTKDGTDSQWKDDPGMKKWNAFLDKYMPDANKADSSTVYGYGAAQTLVKVLQMCGDDLTRANVMKQTASLKDFTPDTLLPGITIITLAHRFRAYLAIADAALQGRQVGALRRDLQRRRRHAIARLRQQFCCISEHELYRPRDIVAGAFSCCEMQAGVECSQEPQSSLSRNVTHHN